MMKRTATNRFQIFQALFALVLLAVSLSASAGVTARLSTPQTSIDQPVNLSLESDGEGDESPDLSVLEKDFEILGRATQQSISIINGKMSSKRSLVLTLLPKHTGSLTIPPIPVGKEKTQALELKVGEQPAGKPADAQEARVVLSLNKTKAYPEEEVVLTLKLYQAAGVQGERLDDPQPSLPDTQLKLLDESQYTTQEDGKLYRVLERDYALFAYQAGKLEIGPLEFRGRTGGASIFNLLDDPFSQPRNSSRIIRAVSNRVSLEIAPIPAGFTGDHWLPARNLQLVQTGIEAQGPILAGKPLTRRIMLVADGLMSSQLPSVNELLPDGLKPYEERPQLTDTPRTTGISSSRQSATTLIPTKAGHYTLPAIEIPWWNTDTDKQEIARLPAVELDVMPNPDVTTAVNLATTTPQTGTQAVQDSTLAVEQAGKPAPAAVQNPESRSWLIWTLAAIWLLTLFGWWRSHRRRLAQKPTPTPEESPPSETQFQLAQRVLIDEMKQAYADADGAVARALWLKWAQLKWPQNPPNNLARLARRLPAQQAQAVISLEKALYSPAQKSDWCEFDPESIARPIADAEAALGPDEQLLPLNP